MSEEINPFQSTPPARKKRVLFMITQSEFGGAQRFLFNLLSRLDKSRYELAVATGIAGDQSFSTALRTLDIPVYLIESLVRNEHLIHDIEAVFEVKNLIKKITPDTLFLMSSKAGFIGALAAHLVGPDRPKVIYRIGGWSFNDPWPAWKKYFLTLLEKKSARWKDIIIVNNRHDLEQAKVLDIKPRQHLLMVHNGIDPYKILLLSRNEARTQLSELMPPQDKTLLQEKRIIGTIANFYPAKGLNYLVQAAALASDNTVFIIIGDGQERKNLEHKITELGLEHKVFLLGRLSEASRYLLAFDIYVLSSVKEGFPWVVLEAMAAKLPIIATRVGAVPEIIEDGVSGYIVAPRDVNNLADRINTLLHNESTVKEMGIQAHQKILFSFTLDAMVRQIEQLL